MGHLHMWSVMVRIVAYSPLAMGLASMGGGGGGALTTTRGIRGAEGVRRVRARVGVLRLVALDGLEGLARPDRPKRWTLPITALRVTPPSLVAIWLADKPSAHNFVKISTLSSVHAMPDSPFLESKAGIKPTDKVTHFIAQASLIKPTLHLVSGFEAPSLPSQDDVANLS